MDKSWGGERKELEVGKSRKQLQHSQGELLVAWTKVVAVGQREVD